MLLLLMKQGQTIFHYPSVEWVKLCLAPEWLLAKGPLSRRQGDEGGLFMFSIRGEAEESYERGSG